MTRPLPGPEQRKGSRAAALPISSLRSLEIEDKRSNLRRSEVGGQSVNVERGFRAYGAVVFSEERHGEGRHRSAFLNLKGGHPETRKLLHEVSMPGGIRSAVSRRAGKPGALTGRREQADLLTKRRSRIHKEAERQRGERASGCVQRCSATLRDAGRA